MFVKTEFKHNQIFEVQRKLDLANTDLAENLDLNDTPQKILATIFDFYYISLLEIAENLVLADKSLATDCSTKSSFHCTHKKWNNSSLQKIQLKGRHKLDKTKYLSHILSFSHIPTSRFIFLKIKSLVLFSFQVFNFKNYKNQDFVQQSNSFKLLFLQFTSRWNW